ncbi:MAG TPA: bifunctional nicotinamidase/pyrazinamidase [Magnetospirillaceae bacterium]|jgi:nicotinamidase/pyrazinamidase
MPSIPPAETDALIVIDVQNDFCPGGALEVRDGDAVVASINRLARSFRHVILTQDWHPAGHASFASQHKKLPFETTELAYGTQVLWPDHCVQNTRGAAFHEDLAVPQAELILRKGFRPEIDSYSAFAENDRTTPTGLASYLRERGLTRLFLAGLAFDFCVLYSALDGKHAGFDCSVIADACRSVDLAGSHGEAVKHYEAAGVSLVQAAQIA